MNKFTKGPWEVGSINDEEGEILLSINIKAPDGYHVSKVSSRSKEEIYANAQLISAAPELLEALEDLINAVKDIRGFDIENYCLNAFMKANLAIVKAKI